MKTTVTAVTTVRVETIDIIESTVTAENTVTVDTILTIEKNCDSRYYFDS